MNSPATGTDFSRFSLFYFDVLFLLFIEYGGFSGHGQRTEHAPHGRCVQWRCAILDSIYGHGNVKIVLLTPILVMTLPPTGCPYVIPAVVQRPSSPISETHSNLVTHVSNVECPLVESVNVLHNEHGISIGLVIVLVNSMFVYSCDHMFCVPLTINSRDAVMLFHGFLVVYGCRAAVLHQTAFWPSSGEVGLHQASARCG